MQRIAILYQSEPPPVRSGVIKPMKAGGYSDSGADIAVELIKNNLKVICPVRTRKNSQDTDWVFADSQKGIEKALNQGANLFWLNTVLFKNHNITNFMIKT